MSPRIITCIGQLSGTQNGNPVSTFEFRPVVLGIYNLAIAIRQEHILAIHFTAPRKGEGYRFVNIRVPDLRQILDILAETYWSVERPLLQKPS